MSYERKTLIIKYFIWNVYMICYNVNWSLLNMIFYLHIKFVEKERTHSVSIIISCIFFVNKSCRIELWFVYWTYYVIMIFWDRKDIITFDSKIMLIEIYRKN